MANTVELFEKLSNTLEDFKNELSKHPLNKKVTDNWTVKDILCHVTFWHMNYAQNYSALAKGIEPPLLQGPYYMINEYGVKKLRKNSTQMLLKKLDEAHKSLEDSILKKGVKKMTYKKGGITYATPEFLQVIESHIRGHRVQLRRAK